MSKARVVTYEDGPYRDPKLNEAVVIMLAEIAAKDISQGVAEAAIKQAYLNTYGEIVTTQVFGLLESQKKAR